MSERCVFNGQTKPRLVKGRHTGDCQDETCEGCAECEGRHCIVCGVRHVEQQTCISCVSSTRDDLRAVPKLASHLHQQGAAGGRDGRLEAARPIPGGEAAVLYGPSGSPMAQMRQIHSLASRGIDTSHRDDESPADPTPPLLTLATWEDDWREYLDHDPAKGRATIKASVAYLDNGLDYIAQRHPAFDEFATDMRRLRATLENVLHAGDRDDPANVACFDCGGQLVRKMLTTGMDDHWTCKRCRRRYTDPEYHLAVRARIEDQTA